MTIMIGFERRMVTAISHEQSIFAREHDPGIFLPAKIATVFFVKGGFSTTSSAKLGTLDGFVFSFVLGGGVNDAPSAAARAPASVPLFA